MDPCQPRLTVYYDGGCPACRREMAHYQLQPGASSVDFVDASSDADALITAGLDRQAAIERLHARDAEGRWFIGVPAFRELWLRLPRYAPWARRFLPLLDSPAMAWAYARFCRWRLRRRCGPTGCPLPHQSSTRQNTALR